MKPTTFFATIALLLVPFALLLPIRVKTRVAFICENTGSRYGFTVWRIGGKTANWYKASPLEEFMKQKHPDKLQHQWTSYAGTGKNIFGQNLSFGHGLPGHILQVDNRLMEMYLAKISDEEKFSLYQKLASGDKDTARLAIDTILGILPDTLPETNSTKHPPEQRLSPAPRS
jgi:hypothetical protein